MEAIRLFYLLFSFFFLLSNCSIKRRIQTNSKTTQNTELKIEKDSVNVIKVQKSDTIVLKGYDFVNELKENLGLTFRGSKNTDSAKIVFKKTDEGIDLTIKGAVSLGLTQQKEVDHKIKDSFLINKEDSNYSNNVKTNLKKEENKKTEAKNSFIDKFKLSFSIWIYIILGLFIFLFLFFYLKRKK